MLRADYNNDVLIVELLLTHDEDIIKADQRGEIPISAATRGNTRKS